MSCRQRPGIDSYIEADVLTANLPRVFEDADAVIHLAALTNTARGNTRDCMQRVNLEGTARVARACAALGVGLLFPSTTSVYGVPKAASAKTACPKTSGRRVLMRRGSFSRKSFCNGWGVRKACRS